MTATTIGAGQTSSGLTLNDGDTALVFAGGTALTTHPGLSLPDGTSLTLIGVASLNAAQVSAG